MFSIRVATPDDGLAICDIYAHYIRETAITFHMEPPAVAEFQQLIEDVLKVYPWYVAVDTEGQGTVVGYAYASQHHPRPAYRWSVTSSIYLDPAHTGKGIGKPLYVKLIETLKQQGFRMVHGGVSMPNAGSQALHESLGFERVATFPCAGFKLGEWRDVAWWVLDLMKGLDRTQSVPEPIPFPQWKERDQA